MCRVSRMSVLLAFVMQTSAEQMMGNQVDGAQKLIGKFIDKLANQELQTSPLLHLNLLNTVLGKPSHLAAFPGRHHSYGHLLPLRTLHSSAPAARSRPRPLFFTLGSPPYLFSTCSRSASLRRLPCASSGGNLDRAARARKAGEKSGKQPSPKKQGVYARCIEWMNQSGWGAKLRKTFPFLKGILWN
eukprot:gnl/TRDRNA2_/TRDRNA2_164855_c0_seq1.p1 gnl/TRDRNA2_/TRDRNA2_164855_c0~~gnl/TRDRNA2_/TRDRNA2_164855_c0_seq1.p1  ORF type:complete len:187 (+),score=13.60 gnl/TRDRNA2_/TRDRNA2_164855_c0_seq1:64-624(+)